jgi:hypothetical protein
MFAALMTVCCDEAGKLQVDELQRELDALKGETRDVPDAGEATQPEDVPYGFTFDRARYGVDAGGSVTIGYSIPEAASIEVSVPEGWSATLDAAASEIEITAPDPASPVEMIVTATAADGRSTSAILPVMVRDPYTDATRTDVAAMAYFCFYREIATDYHFGKMAECGMNMLTIEASDNWLDQLNLAQKYGLKGVLFVNGAAGDYYRNPSDTKLTSIIEVAKNHPALAGYQIFDEPSTEKIDQIKFEKDRIEELDPNPAHPVYVNMHPSSASRYSLGVDDYFEYVETLVTECDLKFITFDQYPVFQGYVDPTWIRSLAAVRESALRHNIPFWAFTLCCREQNREDPTLENIRLQCNTNLLFGAQVNQFFVYRNTSGTNLAPLLIKDGTATYTEAYDACKAYCTEMHNFGFVFAQSNIKAVRNINVVNNWLEHLGSSDLPSQVKSLFTTREALASIIENNGNEYIAVANGIWNMSQTVSIELNDMVYMLDHDGVFTELEPGQKHDIDLEGGDMVVFKVK